MKSTLSLVRIVNDKLADLFVEEQCRELLNDIQNVMLIVEEKLEEQAAESAPEYIFDCDDFEPRSDEPFQIASLGKDKWALTVAGNTLKLALKDGKLFMGFTDLARVLGYKAPERFAIRHKDCGVEKISMEWRPKGKLGMYKHDISCIDIESATKIIRKSAK